MKKAKHKLGFERVDIVDTLSDFDKTKGYFTKSNSSAYDGTLEFDFVKSKYIQ